MYYTCRPLSRLDMRYQGRLVNLRKKLSGSLSFAPLLIGLALGGNLLWMNVRSDDPLPAGFVQYTPAAFAAAQAAGGPIMVDVYASWCTTCKAQHAVLKDLLDDPRYAGIKGFRVDFEGDEEWVRPTGCTSNRPSSCSTDSRN